MFHRLPDNPMERRFIGLFPFRQATGHFFYSRNSSVAELMQDLKYRRFPGLARYLGEIVGRELLPTGFLSDIDAIVPVPMHFMKKARRGYNQTEEIARGVSEQSSIPVITNLRAVRPHRTQTSVGLAGRLTNTEGIFRFFDGPGLKMRKFLILDDVCTTGSTLTSAADALLAELPDSEISLLTVGVTF